VENIVIVGQFRYQAVVDFTLIDKVDDPTPGRWTHLSGSTAGQSGNGHQEPPSVGGAYEQNSNIIQAAMLSKANR